jgi:SlyX protein
VENSLEQIQTKIAFLERANTDLSDVVFRQQKEIQALAAKLREISERLNAAESGDAARAPQDERPPHY